MAIEATRASDTAPRVSVCFSNRLHNTWPHAQAVGPLQIASAGDYECSNDTYEVVDDNTGADCTVTLTDCEYAI